MGQVVKYPAAIRGSVTVLQMGGAEKPLSVCKGGAGCSLIMFVVICDQQFRLCARPRMHSLSGGTGPRNVQESVFR